MNILIPLLVFGSAVVILLTALIVIQAIRGREIVMKPLRPTLIIMAIPLLFVIVLTVTSTFEWLDALIPDTDWWDGATTMGLIVAVVGFLSLIAGGYVTAMANASTDPPDSPPDHLGDAIRALAETQQKLIDKFHEEVTVEVDGAKPGG